MSQPPRKKQKVVVTFTFDKPVGVRTAAMVAEGALRIYASGDTNIKSLSVSSYRKVIAAEKIRMHFTEEDCLEIVDRLADTGTSAAGVAMAMSVLYKEKRWSAMELAIWLEKFQNYDPRTMEDPVRFVLDMQEELQIAMQEAGE